MDDYQSCLRNAAINYKSPWMAEAADRMGALEAALQGEAAFKAGAIAERASVIEKLEGLKPVDSNAFLDAYRGALLDGIRCILLGAYPQPTDLTECQADGWRPIETFDPVRDGKRALISGGTYLYDVETYADFYPFCGVTIANYNPDRLNHSQWARDGYGREFDGQYWHKPTRWMPLPAGIAQPEGDA